MSDAATRPDLAKILRNYLNEQLEEDRRLHLSTKAGRPVYALEGTFDALQMTSQMADHEIVVTHQARYADAIADRDIREVARHVDQLMQEHGLSGDETRVELGLGLLDALYELTKVQMRRIDGALAKEVRDKGLEPALTASAAFSNPVVNPAVEVANGPLLSTMVSEFVAQQVATGEWRGQTQSQNSKTYRMFIDVCGDLSVDAYTKKDHVVPFVDVLRRLPANHGKSQRDAALSTREIADRATAAGSTTISGKTCRRHLSALGSLFDWLIARDLRPEPNPAHGLRLGRKGIKGEERKAWEGEKLTRLFSGPAHTGSHPIFRSKPGPTIIKDAYYWLPLLGLYQGARLEEMAQLVREDVREVEGIMVLDINDQDFKQVKNDTSRRLVPIHPKLIALGFPDYVKTVAPTGSNRVFPELKPGGKDKKAGYDFTRKFGHYRRGIGVYERWLDFHSLRHTFISKLADKQVPEITIATIAGHAGVTQTSQYARAKKPSVATLLAALRLAEWDEIPF